jgi:nitroreductase
MKWYASATALLATMPGCALQPLRHSEYAVHPIILNRWSPRAFSGESLTQREIETIFEAARWAPSSYNDQPWMFLYAQKGRPSWDLFYSMLVPFNQAWAQSADLLIVVLSRTTFAETGKPSPTHSFDTGAAVQNLALQAHSMGIAVHVMGGFDHDRVRTELGVPEGYAIEAMIAVGKPGKSTQLSPEMRNMEKPSDRNPLSLMMKEGSFV